MCNISAQAFVWNLDDATGLQGPRGQGALVLQGRDVVFSGNHSRAPFMPTSPLPGISSSAMQESIVVRVSEDVLSNVLWALAVEHDLDFPEFNITLGILEKHNYTISMAQNASSVQFPRVALDESGAVLAMNVEVTGVPATVAPASGTQAPPAAAAFTSAFLLGVGLWVA